MLHHIVTILLIFGSFCAGQWRIGSIFMITFDPADVPLHIAKQFKYLGFQTLADINFVIFMLTFFVTRIVMFPYYVWTAHYETQQFFVTSTEVWWCIKCADVLLLLNLYWFWLILRVLYKLISGGSVEDIRSDDEEDNADTKQA